MNFFLPPAKAQFSWWKSVWPNLASVDFPAAVQEFLVAPKVLVGDAWVNMLAEGFKGLAKADNRKKVVLPGYSCNEFVKAILLADLEPLFIDLDAQGKIQTHVLDALDKTEMLALLAVNTSGIASPLAELRTWCDAHQCYMVEDAGYTFLGEDENGKRFGSFGHVSIINMSEGKIIPCGGAAWVINEAALVEKYELLDRILSDTEPLSNSKEATRLAVYRLGSSLWGYNFYQLFRKLGLGDWKARLTSEPSRLGEDYASGDLEWKEDKIVIKAAHLKILENIRIRPWNRVRQQAALLILKSRKQLIHQRKQKVEKYKQLLKALPLELPPLGMPVRLPILLSVNDKQTIEKLADRGIKKQYPPSWPMAGLDLPSSKKFYLQAFTLPLHESVTIGDIEKKSDLIRTYIR
jgi:dTDP-4-amino-4,6-dideoxygalactose transaminase